MNFASTEYFGTPAIMTKFHSRYNGTVRIIVKHDIALSHA